MKKMNEGFLFLGNVYRFVRNWRVISGVILTKIHTCFMLLHSLLWIEHHLQTWLASLLSFYTSQSPWTSDIKTVRALQFQSQGENSMLDTSSVFQGKNVSSRPWKDWIWSGLKPNRASRLVQIDKMRFRLMAGVFLQF